MADSVLSPDRATKMRRYCILGTAGHIDHGKSSLVKALTGTDPDRLPEEQARGMTIELGYAHLELADSAGGEAMHVGIVDVPGHERFVRTMVAGATGIDLGMLVVAADDGVMPQTREHVDILNLLGVRKGIITLSKIDLAPEDRVADVRAQIAAMVDGMPLADWPVIAYSAHTGRGLDEVRATIAEQAAALPAPSVGSVFRLAIDRVFAVQGRGTVVTGSVIGGTVASGAALELLPPGLQCKVREVQSYGKAVTGAGAGQRAALNLTGVDRERLDRGMELATPGYLAPSQYVDTRVRMLKRGKGEKAFASHQRVRICMGTMEEMAMLVVVGADGISPGGESLAQLRFRRPVVSGFGQRFILRNETSEATIGGGIVVRPVSRRFRPHHAEELEALRRAESDDVFVRYEEAMRQAGFSKLAAMRVACGIGVNAAEIPAMEARLRAEGRSIAVAPGVVVHAGALAALEERALAFLRRYHQTQPLEPGVQRDRFIGWLDKRSSPGLGRVLLSRMETAGQVTARGPYVAHGEFRPALSAEDAQLLEKLVQEIVAAGFDPPVWTSLRTTAGLSRQRSKTLEDIAKTEARLIAFAPQHYIARQAVSELMDVVKRLGKGRPFKLAEVRDALHLSRRVVQPLLEHLDRVGVTKRVGDDRVLVEIGR